MRNQSTNSSISVERELVSLYQRRAVVDQLIRSLELYASTQRPTARPPVRESNLEAVNRRLAS